MFRLSKLFWLHLLFIVLLFKNKLSFNPKRHLVLMGKKHVLIRFVDLSTFGVKKSTREFLISALCYTFDSLRFACVAELCWLGAECNKSSFVTSTGTIITFEPRDSVSGPGARWALSVSSSLA